MRRLVIALLAVPILFISSVYAGGKKDLCVKRVKEAISILKKEGKSGFAKLNDMDQSQWNDESYVFVLDENGVLKVHLKPALVGKNMLNVKDIKGRFFVKDFLKLGKSGSGGWVSYYWRNPKTGKISLKHSYCEGITIEGEVYTVCSGYQEG